MGRSEDEIRAELEAKRTRLLADMAKLEEPPEDSTAIGFGKRVGEGTSFAVERLVQVGVHDQMQAQLEAIARALAKLDEGTYGTCDVCRSEIAPARLEELPWSVRCVNCASR